MNDANLMNNKPQTNGVHIGFAIAVLIFCVLVGGICYSIYGFTSDAFLWTIRNDVKIAFFFFVLSYIASPLDNAWTTKFSRFLVRHRATTGASFAIAQLTAGVSVFVVWSNWPEFIHAVSSPVDRVLGLVVYAIIIVMLCTSNKASIERLGKSLWGKIHTYGMAIIWIAYMLDYGRRAVDTHFLFIIPVAALVAILILRFSQLRTLKKQA